MKMIFRSTLAAAALAGATALIPMSANAGVGVSVGIGVPGPVYYGPDYAGGYYYDPIYFGGAWYHGPYRWRMENGERVFFVNGGWHGNEWRGGAIPNAIVFRNGGYYRGGRYDGFHDANRINARFHSENGGIHHDRGMRVDRGRPTLSHADMRQDRPATRSDARAFSHERTDRPSKLNH